ncbi:MAG TPA: PadR family transcriptional regulator [Solirubrobacteraceae bacterium]|nr:PadR family transcriptional regulator [Solirubrobacteraceae bacterium]
MSAKHAVLGLLIERPGHGYDVARRLRERFGSSGFAPTGVYSALDQLSGEGLVRAGGPLGAGGERSAPRTIYEATERGCEQFDRWMLAGSSMANIRDELNMKLALSRPRDLPALIELAHKQEQECLARLSQLKSPQASAHGRALSWPEVADLLVRDAEARQLQARIEWLQRATAIMAKLVGTQSGERPARADGSRPQGGEPAAQARVA